MICKIKAYWKSLKISCSIFWHYCFHVAEAIFTVIGAITCLIPIEEIGILSLQYRCFIVAAILVFSVICALLFTLFRKKRKLWQNGSGSISLQYGNIIKLGFSRSRRSNKIIVIPVNTHFDTILENPTGNTRNPLISPSTLHGQWIKHMTETITVGTLNQLILDNLAIQGLTPEDDSNRLKGNEYKYPIGTTAIVPGVHGITFFLLALSEFDSENTAQCSDEDFITAIRSLIKFYNRNGQGLPLYLPIMGTHLSRTGYSHKEALNRILSILMLESSNIHGNCTLVIYGDDRDKITIW